MCHDASAHATHALLPYVSQARVEKWHSLNPQNWAKAVGYLQTCCIAKLKAELMLGKWGIMNPIGGTCSGT